PTVAIFSASSSEISISNSSSSSITNSTTSNESAPKSSRNDASNFTSLSSTPKRSTTTFETRSNTVDKSVTSPQKYNLLISVPGTLSRALHSNQLDCLYFNHIKPLPCRRLFGGFGL